MPLLAVVARGETFSAMFVWLSMAVLMRYCYLPPILPLSSRLVFRSILETVSTGFLWTFARGL